MARSDGATAMCWAWALTLGRRDLTQPLDRVPNVLRRSPQSPPFRPSLPEKRSDIARSSGYWWMAMTLWTARGPLQAAIWLEILRPDRDGPEGAAGTRRQPAMNEPPQGATDCRFRATTICRTPIKTNGILTRHDRDKRFGTGWRRSRLTGASRSSVDWSALSA